MDWDSDPLTALCFLECRAWALLSCEPSSHLACYTHSQSHPSLSHMACMRGLHWLCLSPRGEEGSARAPGATFLSLTNEGGRPWVVTDTGFQLLTKTAGWASGHTAT